MARLRRNRKCSKNPRNIVNETFCLPKKFNPNGLHLKHLHSWFVLIFDNTCMLNFRDSNRQPKVFQSIKLNYFQYFHDTKEQKWFLSFCNTSSNNGNGLTGCKRWRWDYRPLNDEDTIAWFIACFYWIVECWQAGRFTTKVFDWKWVQPNLSIKW